MSQQCNSPDAHFAMCDGADMRTVWGMGIGKAEYKVTVGAKDDPNIKFTYDMCPSCQRCAELDYELGERSFINVEEIV